MMKQMTTQTKMMMVNVMRGYDDDVDNDSDSAYADNEDNYYDNELLMMIMQMMMMIIILMRMMMMMMMMMMRMMMQMMMMMMIILMRMMMMMMEGWMEPVPRAECHRSLLSPVSWSLSPTLSISNLSNFLLIIINSDCLQKFTTPKNKTVSDS